MAAKKKSSKSKGKKNISIDASAIETTLTEAMPKTVKAVKKLAAKGKLLIDTYIHPSSGAKAKKSTKKTAKKAAKKAAPKAAKKTAKKAAKKSAKKK